MQDILKLAERRENLKQEMAELNSKVRHTEDEIIEQLFERKQLDFLSVNWVKLNRVMAGSRRG